MYAGRCYGYFYRLTGDRDLSDELLSELFIKLVEKIGSYKGGAFESWLFKIASNTSTTISEASSDAASCWMDTGPSWNWSPI
jgi:DNA-directed RNA polymerase specialized sigma24 family protein